jgi:hypothetical protein
MRNEMKLRECIARAQAMKNWAEGDDGFFAMMDALERLHVEELLNSKDEDIDLREHIYHRVRVLRDMKECMRVVIANGANAEKELEYIETAKSVKPFH